MSDGPIEGSEDWEFERRFLVRELTEQIRTEHMGMEAIVQAYLFAHAGYGVRVRLRFADVEAAFPHFDEAVDYEGAYERRVLAELLANHEENAHAMLTVKSNPSGASRYERELEVDITWAAYVLRHCTGIVLKNRYEPFIEGGNWAVDVFGGQNAGLIIAECEDVTPVSNIAIPGFCLTEVTDDVRFTNDSLSRAPWREWKDVFEREFAAIGPRFLDL